MQLDVTGRLLVINVPETVSCTACDVCAERLSSGYQGEEIAHHHYRCQAEECPAGGTIVEHERVESGEYHRVGSVFGDRDLAVRLATREHPEILGEATEVAP